MPWASYVVNHIQFLEIDASYKAVRPYNYCIFHGVLYNSSIPFGISIYPTEKTDLYELLFDALEHFKINKKDFENKHVLSDMNDAIIAFSKNHSMQNHFCHRHIIEVFGSNSGFSIWVTKLLNCKTEFEYLQIREEIIAELNIYIEKLEDMPINEKDLKNIHLKINNLQIMLALPDEIESGKNEKNISIKQSIYYLPKWANWYRRAYHIPRCSNHSEGAHGNINQLLPKHGIFSLKTGFRKITNYIFSYLNNRENIYGNSFEKKHRKILEKIREVLKKKDDKYLQFCTKECDCEDNMYNNNIFGVDFPCIHSILNQLISEDFKQVIQETKIDFYELFLLCFKFCPTSFYESKKFDKNIEELSKKICLNFCNDKPLYQNQEMFDIITQLATNFLKCFRYELPPFLKVDVDQYKTNYTSVVNDKKRIKFNKRCGKKIYVKLNEDEVNEEKEEINFWINKTDSEFDIQVKQKYFQTKNEIKKVYPSLKDKIDTLCFYNYMENIKKKTDSLEEIERKNINIICLLANFKMECWKMADDLAKDKKFYG